ncbi:MAG: prepilin-type N-terminal cleavage/methylation domain-containing protein [Bdellovibrionaceae bacterium]|nr:prepilin-type N-terminal cleavage/methylation domain-containing protein [Bdellovibrio sp.]
MPPQLNRGARQSERGFSLMEMAIVLVIIGAVIAIAAPRLFDKKSETRKVFREFILAGKDLRSKAKLYGTTYRLAFQLDAGQQNWWVEKSTRVTLIDKKKFENERNQSKETFLKEEPKKPSDFQPDTTIFKKKQVLPKGYSFKHIESGTQEVVLTEGVAYIHFFPQGLIETSAIQIEEPKKNIWTLVYNPITGHSDIIPEPKLLKDLAR